MGGGCSSCFFTAAWAQNKHNNVIVSHRITLACGFVYMFGDLGVLGDFVSLGQQKFFSCDQQVTFGHFPQPASGLKHQGQPAG